MNAIGRPSSTRLFPLLGKAHPKWWHETKHPWDRILQFRFHATILGGLFQAAEKADWEGRPIAFKRRFFNFPHRGETKKHPWDRILQFRFHATILGGLFQAAEKCRMTKVVQLRSKGVFSTFPIGAKRKNTLGIEFYNFGFMPPFWVGFSKQRKSRIDEGRPIAFKRRFFNFPHRGETKKHPWDRILQFRFHATILGGLFQAAEKAGLA